MTKDEKFRDNRSKPSTSLLVVEIFVFLSFLFFLDGFIMVLAGVFGFFDFFGFSYGLSSEAAVYVRTHHCSHISCAYNINMI